MPVEIESGATIGSLPHRTCLQRPSFQLLINHDDEMREYSYAEPGNESLAAAKEYGFHVVSIKNDWRSVLAKEEE